MTKICHSDIATDVSQLKLLCSHHPLTLVRLLGVCNEGDPSDDLLLVNEHAPLGSLDRLIHSLEETDDYIPFEHKRTMLQQVSVTAQMTHAVHVTTAVPMCCPLPDPAAVVFNLKLQYIYLY